jgi:hypothetical protein
MALQNGSGIRKLGYNAQSYVTWAGGTSSIFLSHAFYERVAEKICMKDLKLVIVVVVVALIVRILLLRDSSSHISPFLPNLDTIQVLKSLNHSFISNRFYLYIIGVVYLVIFARKNSMKQLWNSFNEDVSPLLRGVVYFIGFTGFSVLLYTFI